MLEGIRVLDFSRVIAAPYCAMLLADLGADVIKIERPPHGDDSRQRQPMNAVFAAMNRNKRGVALDLQHPDGAKVAFELARRADVIVENFLPGVAERLGIGYAAVSAVNPGLVYLSLTGFGQSGPLIKRPAYNMIAQGMSGVMAVTGPKGGPPHRVGGTAADAVTSYLAFGAINAALVQRFRTGQGQHLDVTLQAANLGLLADTAARFLESGVRPGREGNENPNLAPAEALGTADGYLALVIGNPGQWERLSQALDDEELRTDPRFSSNANRIANRPAMIERLERHLAGATTAEWIARFEAAGVPCGPIYEFDQVFDDAQIRHLGLVTEVEQPDYGPVKMLRAPFFSTALPPTPLRPAPRLGEHTAEVLAELGMSAEEIGRLAERGAILTG
jgi:crotonobetainyl-CoA:carnitine CoA-transferase CaiB-like acyl-CoA transferase